MDHTPHALVCDGDPVVVAIVSMLLHDAGFDVTETASGAALTAALASREPDLIVLDLSLPDVSGDELLSGIMKVAPHCRVILFSSRVGLSDTSDHAVFARVTKSGTKELADAISRATAANG